MNQAAAPQRVEQRPRRRGGQAQSLIPGLGAAPGRQQNLNEAQVYFNQATAIDDDVLWHEKRFRHPGARIFRICNRLRPVELK